MVTIHLKALFAATLFVSAFLLFLVEPMVARTVLPVLGGAPMVWTGCVLFFQCMLLAGYAYAHGTAAWLTPRWRTAAQVLLLLAPVALLPFLGAPDAPPVDRDPLGWLLLMLAGSIGAPFLALASSTSTLQYVYAGGGRERDPYFLYVSSNAGSLLGLLAYPFVVEPTLTLGMQTRLWTVGYMIFVALSILSVTMAARMRVEPAADATPAAEPLTSRRRARWVMLAAIPSSLMLGVTSYLTADIASFPLLWVVPLAIYLLTLILAFSRSRFWRPIADRRFPIAVVVVLVFILLNIRAPGGLVIAVHLAAFALAGLLCHATLADDRPPASQLTEFYLWIAVGGAVGGLFNTLAAPLLFTSIAEYPIAFVLAVFVRRGDDARGAQRTRLTADLVVAAVVGLVTLALITGFNRFGGPSKLALLIPAALCFSQLRKARRFALAVAALLMVSTILPFGSVYGRVLLARRTFFGVYRITRDASGSAYALYNGTTMHGLERMAGDRAHEPLTYYHRAGPFGQAFERLPSASSTPRVAVVGLGIGALASYAGPAQQWTFFEIDPLVEQLARDERYFSHLAACGSRCRVIVGDARLSMARRKPGEYGLIVLDAFSSDAIPVHLLTREAIALYLSRLAPDGALALHISNHNLRLDSVLGRLGSELGLTSLVMLDQHSVDIDAQGMTTSMWMVMARNPANLGSLVSDPHWSAPRVTATTPLWTDDFSNILSVLRLWS